MNPESFLSNFRGSCQEITEIKAFLYAVQIFTSSFPKRHYIFDSCVWLFLLHPR